MRAGSATVLTIVVAMLAACGPVTMPQPPKVDGQQAPSIRQLAGTWYGWHTYGGVVFRVNVSIDPDGRTMFAFTNNPAMHYVLVLEDGTLRYGQDPRKPCCSAQFSEERGRQYLAFLWPNGTVWIECQRDR